MDVELQRLIKEQSQDNKSSYVSKDARETTTPNTQLDKLPAKMKFGQPAKIASCRESAGCPNCGQRKLKRRDRDENNILLALPKYEGFDALKEGKEIVGAVCGCGWSYCQDEYL